MWSVVAPGVVVLDPGEVPSDAVWMALPLRHLPVTPLDELRACLDDHLENDATSQVRLHQLLQQLRQLALPELGRQLAEVSASPGQRRFILGLTAKFDWPEWVPWIFRWLGQEQDLGVFDEGCAALGRLELRSAREALGHLARQHTDPDRQVILHRELSLQESPSLGFYLGRLLEGEGNPRLARQGARGLAALAEPADLPTLLEALSGADPLASRLLLRALAELPGETPGSLLLRWFQDTLHILEDLQSVLAHTRKMQPGGRIAARTELSKSLASRLRSRSDETSETLMEVLSEGEETQALSLLDTLRSKIQGPYEHFLAEALSLLLEGKVARFGALVAEAQDRATQQLASLGALLDLVSASLARLVEGGRLLAHQVLPAFRDAFDRFPHCEGLDHAFCRLLSPEDGEALERILQVSDPKRRAACLDLLGSREVDALVPFFLKAMQDPIVEVGNRTMHHFGKLPSSLPAVMALFESGQPEQVRKALQIFAENATQAASEPLMAFLQTDVRDDLIVEAVEALGAIRCPRAAPVLLDLLHDGKPARLQEALVGALATLATDESGLGLLAKATHLKLPQVLIVALEGVLAAFPGFERALPREALPALEQLITRCCDSREGDGQWLRTILATQHLYCFDQGLYSRLKDTFSDFLFNLRTRGGWDRDTNDRVAAVVKELGRRSASLAQIAVKEEKLRSLVKSVPPQGPGRTAALLALRDALRDPDFILREELARELGTFVTLELERKDQDWPGLARLCEIGGLTRQTGLAEPLKEIYHQASGLGLRSAAKEGLLALGLDESEIVRRAPIRSILLLEPSAFFRKRLMAVLSGWEIREAGGRIEAEALLSEGPVDLLISELADAHGDLRDWLKSQCAARRCRQVLLSTAVRETSSAEPWLLGTLLKPYPPERLLQTLNSGVPPQ